MAEVRLSNQATVNAPERQCTIFIAPPDTANEKSAYFQVLAGSNWQYKETRKIVEALLVSSRHQ